MITAIAIYAALLFAAYAVFLASLAASRREQVRELRDTIVRALQRGVLHGSQRAARGPWTIRRECLEEWMDGQPCEHQLARARTPMRRTKAAS